MTVVPAKKPSRRASQLWRRLAQTYGARLADQYGATCPPDWCEIVDKTSDDQLSRAMIVVRRNHLQFPPTLGQFEAAIPKKTFGAPSQSIPDVLAVQAARRFPMCGHQLSSVWTYFGRLADGFGAQQEMITSGVTIPACAVDGCRRFGEPGFRLLSKDVVTG